MSSKTGEKIVGRVNSNTIPKRVTRLNFSTPNSVPNLSTANKTAVVKSNERYRPKLTIVEESDDEGILKNKSPAESGATSLSASLIQDLDAVWDSEWALAGKETPLQERSTFQWYLPHFIKNYSTYLDNESKYLDELEATAVRTYLLETGNAIKLRSVFLSNLFITQWTDQNQNDEGAANLNIAKGASFVGESDVDALMTITFKLVEHSSIEDPAHFHFNVIIETSSGVAVSSQLHLLTSVKLGCSRSVVFQIQKKHLSYFSSDDDAIITVECYVYRPPKDWRMASRDVSVLTDFIANGEIPARDKSKVEEISKKCQQNRLGGIVDCLKSLQACQFFDD